MSVKRSRRTEEFCNARAKSRLFLCHQCGRDLVGARRTRAHHGRDTAAECKAGEGALKNKRRAALGAPLPPLTRSPSPVVSGQRHPITLRYRLCSWDVFPYDLLPNQLRPFGLASWTGQQRGRLRLRYIGFPRRSGGSGEPWRRSTSTNHTSLPLVFLGRFRIRPVSRSASPYGLASRTGQ